MLWINAFISADSSRRKLLKSGAVGLTAVLASRPAISASNMQQLSQPVYETGLFVDISKATIPGNAEIIRTSGWSAPGIGFARYAYNPKIGIDYVRAQPATSALCKDGRGFQLIEKPISIEMTGASTQRDDNSLPLQYAIDAVFAKGGGQVIIPSGTFLFRNSLIMRTGVDIVGMGQASSLLHYIGNGVAIDGVGSAEKRKLFQLRDICILGTKAGNSAIAVKLAWNQRSSPLLERVRISDFGHYAIYFAGTNWLVSFRDINIHDCGKRANGSSAISRARDTSDIQSLADIKFSGLIIENCGSATSTAGGVNFPASTNNPTQGFWIEAATIEGNSGSNECAFENADLVSIAQSYFEIAISDGVSRSAINLVDSNLSLTNCRMASDPNNQSGASIVARGRSTVHAAGNIWDSDFRFADIIAEPSVQLDGSDMTKSDANKIRVKYREKASKS